MAITKVTSSGLTDDSVTAAKIDDGTLATADIAPGSIATAKLAGSIANAKLANSAITIGGQSISLGASNTVPTIDWQAVVTADGSTTTTMVSGRGYFIDTTSAAHTVTLPSSASAGDYIAIKDYAGTFGTNNVRIARNSHKIQGNALDGKLATNRASVRLVYVDATKGWLFYNESNVTNLQKHISATGGTVTTSGDFKIHTFTGDGNFIVSRVGSGATGNTVSYMVVAGGGAGGSDSGTGGGIGTGGGGAGGFREGRQPADSYTVSPLNSAGGLTVTAATIPVTVGGGGASGAPSGNGAKGSNSVFSTITSTGGGGGLGNPNCSPVKDGGSGGGGSYNASGGSGNTPPVSPSQGNNGESGAFSGSYPGGGGGGAGEAGGTDGDSYGGDGVTTSITASSVAYAGGGGGSKLSTNYYGFGGSGGGGNGGPIPGGDGSAGTANRGGGGGGSAGHGGCGAAGGSGIVVIRYKFQ